MPKRIVLPDLGPEAHQRLRAISRDLQFIVAADERAAAEAVTDADALYMYCTPQVIAAGRNLRWVQVQSAGVEHVLFPEMVESPAVLTNARGIYGTQLADHTMAFILGFSRCLPKLWDCQRREVWESRANLTSHELLGLTLLVIGLGGAGRETARRAKAFGMHVIGVKRLPAARPHEVDELHTAEALSDLLPRADYVAVCCPLTHRTRRFIGREALARMKPTAVLTNVARGGIVDTGALVEALREGRIAGAGLDVTDPEPLPAGHPLWQMPNVIITPHSSGQTPAAHARMLDLFCENLRRFAAGRPLLNVVDKAEGY